MIKIKTEFVNEFHNLETVDDLVIYISIKNRAVMHKCPCGCGETVYMILGKDDWCLIYDGTLSLTPSVGNFYFECKSHYFIVDDSIFPADRHTRKLLRKTKKKMMKSNTNEAKE